MIGGIVRKKIRKLVALAVSVMVMASFTVFSGCDDSGDKVGVDVFQYKVEAREAIEKAAKEYEKTHDNVEIKIKTVGGGDDYGSALRAEFQSGKEPAIYNIGGPQDTLDWMEHLVVISNTDLVDKAVENTLGAVTKDGKVYGYPLALEGYGFIYNKEIFKKAGINPEDINIGYF